MKFKQNDTGITKLGDLLVFAGSLILTETEDGIPLLTTLISGASNLERLRVTSTIDASLSSTLHGIQVGPDDGVNLIIDTDEIMSRNNGSTSPLRLQADGGNIITGTTSQLIGGRLLDRGGSVRNIEAFGSTSDTAGVRLRAAIDDLGADGGTVDARGLVGTQTIDVDIFANLTAEKPIAILCGSNTFIITTIQNIPPQVTFYLDGTVFKLNDGAAQSFMFRFRTGTGLATVNSGSANITLNAVPTNGVLFKEGGTIGVFGHVPTGATDRTTVTTDPGSGGTTIEVASTADFASTNGYLRIEGEAVFYTGTTATSFTGCTRGYGGTTAAGHVSGTIVERAVYETYRILSVSGTVDGTLEKPVPLTATAMDFHVGVSDVAFRGNGIIDGDKPDSDSTNNAIGIYGFFANRLFVDDNIKIQHWDHSGIQIVQGRSCTINGTYEDVGWPSLFLGSAIWFFQGTRDCRANIQTTDCNISVAVDSRTTAPDLYDNRCNGNNVVIDRNRGGWKTVVVEEGDQNFVFVRSSIGHSSKVLSVTSPQWGVPDGGVGNVFIIGAVSPISNIVEYDSAMADKQNSLISFTRAATYTLVEGSSFGNQLLTIPTFYSEPYSASITINATRGEDVAIEATDGNAFTINNPTNPQHGRRLSIYLLNSSGGSLGAITWGSEFEFTGGDLVPPLNGFWHIITFVRRTSDKWIEVNRSNISALWGTVNLNGINFAANDSTYNWLYRRDGGIGLHLGGFADQANYYSNDQHIFRSSNNTTRWLIDSGGAYRTASDPGGSQLLRVSSGARLGGDIEFLGDNLLRQSTSDGSDSGLVALAGGGAIDVGRGAAILVHGNEHATFPGQLIIRGGDVATEEILLGGTTRVTLGAFIIGTDPGGSESLRITGDTVLSNNNNYRGRTTGGTNLSLLGLASDDNIYLGDIDSGSGGVFLRTSGVNRVNITSAGNVLVGTDPGGNSLVRMGGDLRLGGGARTLELHNAGDVVHTIRGDADRTGAASSILDLKALWNGDDVAAVLLTAGSDTGNKDDGRIVFQTQSDNAGGLLTRMTVLEDGTITMGTDPGGTERLRIGGEIVLSNNNGYKGRTTGGSNLRLLRLASDNNVYLGDVDSGSAGVIFRSSGVNRVTINNSGQVIVGTDPGGPDILRIGGTIRISSASKVYSVNTNNFFQPDDGTGNFRAGSRGSMILDIDADNNQTDRLFQISKDGATVALLNVSENGNVNVAVSGSILQLGGVNFASNNATYNWLYRRDGTIGLHLGGAGDQNNYYTNGGHIFRSAGASTYWSITTGGHWQPSADDTRDVGTSSNKVRTLYFDRVSGKELLNTSTGTVNDLSIGNVSVLLWSGASNMTLNGIVAGIEGQPLFVRNISNGNTLTLAHEAAGSSSVNRIRLPSGTTRNINQREGVILLYTALQSRWGVMGRI